MTECELLQICGFFKKYSESRNLVCRSFIRAYCRGYNVDKCHRKKYRAEHGKPPPDDMLPSGGMLSDATTL